MAIRIRFCAWVLGCIDFLSWLAWKLILDWPVYEFRLVALAGLEWLLWLDFVHLLDAGIGVRPP